MMCIQCNSNVHIHKHHKWIKNSICTKQDIAYVVINFNECRIAIESNQKLYKKVLQIYVTQIL